MEQTAVEQKKKGSGCLIFILILVGGLLALAVLGGAAYYMGFIPGAPQPTAEAAQPTPTAESAVTEAATQPEAATEAAATEAPAASTPVTLPSVSPYQAGRGVQYPSLASLADRTGYLSILPGQPTVLDYRWCADSETNLSNITDSIALKYTINGMELPISSFTIYQTQVNIELEPGNKQIAFCNVLSGITRDWGEGQYDVNVSFKVLRAYHDGWKQHPKDETTEVNYKVKVTPSSTPKQWDRCKMFEGVKLEIFYPEWKPKKPLEYYFKFENGIPGLEVPVAGDDAPWEYRSRIEDLDSPLCDFQGYAGRLYCKIENAPTGFSNTLRPMSLSVNGCSWPIYYNPIEVMPAMGK